jgi:hypothetical protein
VKRDMREWEICAGQHMGRRVQAKRERCGIPSKRSNNGVGGGTVSEPSENGHPSEARIASVRTSGTKEVEGKNRKITHLDSPLFTNPQKQESGHPEMITHIDTGTWTNLEFPLRRHDFGVDSGNFDTGIQAGSL